MHHNFKFPRFALLVHRNNRDVQYLVECRMYDADTDRRAPVYMLTPTTTGCMERWGAEYVEASFKSVDNSVVHESEHVRQTPTRCTDKIGS